MQLRGGAEFGRTWLRFCVTGNVFTCYMAEPALGTWYKHPTRASGRLRAVPQSLWVRYWRGGGRKRVLGVDNFIDIVTAALREPLQRGVQCRLKGM